MNGYTVAAPGLLQYIHHCISIYISHLVHKHLSSLYFFYYVCYTLPGVVYLPQLHVYT
jgi:hypothetical protein